MEETNYPVLAVTRSMGDPAAFLAEWAANNIAAGEFAIVDIVHEGYEESADRVRLDYLGNVVAAVEV